MKSKLESTGLKVKTRIQAGGRGLAVSTGPQRNHNQAAVAVGLRIKTRIQAGGRGLNHNQAAVSSGL